MTNNTDTTAARIAALAASWIRANESANARLVERFSNPAAIADYTTVESMIQNAARTAVAYRVQMILTHYGEGTEGERHLITEAIRGAQQNLNTTSSGSRAIGQATTEAWLEIAAAANGDRF